MPIEVTVPDPPVIVVGVGEGETVSTTGSGGNVQGGAADVSKVTAVAAAGASSQGGAATVTKVVCVVGSGGSKQDGTAGIAIGFAGGTTTVSVTGSGGSVQGGQAAVTKVTAVPTPAGGNAQGGRGSITAVHTAAPSGGNVQGGEAVISRTTQLAIVTQSLPNAILGLPYHAEIIVSGAVGPVVCEVVDGDLPTGITLQPDGTLIADVVSGSTATFKVQVSAVDELAEFEILGGTQEFTISVAVAGLPPEGITVISPATLPSAFVGSFYSYQLVAVGQGALTFTIAEGQFQPGIVMDENGFIFGLASAAASETVTLLIADGESDPVYFTVTLAALDPIQGQLVITTESLPPAVEGEPYTPFQIIVTGATGPGVTVTAENLPAGTACSTGGWVSGTPTENGTFDDVKFYATRSPDLPTSKVLTFKVAPPPPMIEVTSPVLGSTHAAGTNLTVDWTATNLTTPVPDWVGFLLDDEEVLAAIPLTPVSVGVDKWRVIMQIPVLIPAGSQYNIVIREDVSNATGGSGNFTITAYTPLAFTTAATLPGATQGVAYSQTIGFTGGVGTPTMALAAGSSMPTGMTFNNGAIGGTPSVNGPKSFDVTLSDGVGTPVTMTFFLAIAAAGQIVITTATLPSATVGVAWTPQQLAATGNSGPITWSKLAGSADLSINSSGLVSLVTQSAAGTLTITVKADDGIVTFGTITLTVLVLPVLVPGTYTRVFRDGTVMVAHQGANDIILNGYNNTNPLIVVSQPLNLAVGSLNAPGGMPQGIQVKVLALPTGAVDIDIVGLGTSDGLLNSNDFTSGNPLYFQQSECYFPGRTIHLGSYRGVTEPDPGHFILVRATDLKHPARHHTSVPGTSTSNSKYTPSLSNHFTDGGEGEHWYLTPVADPKETAFLPSPQDCDELLDLFEVNETRIAAYPKIAKLIEQYQHDPANYLNEFAADGTKKITWMLDFTNLINRGSEAGIIQTPGSPAPTPVLGPPPVGNSGYAYFQQYAELANWYAGLHLTTPANQGDNPLRLGYYGGNLFGGIQYARNPGHANAVDSLNYFFAMLDRVIAAGLLRYGSGVTSIYKNLFRDEGTDFFTATDPVTGQPKKFFAKSGMGGGGGQAPTYGKQVFDLAVISAYFLRGRGANARPLYADAFNRRLAQMLSMTSQGWSAAAGGAANPNDGLRVPGNFLRALWWYYRACKLLGMTAQATQLRANASFIIGSMFTVIDQSGNIPTTATNPGGQGNPVLWPPITNSPTTTPLTTSTQDIGVSEGFYLYVTRWMSDDAGLGHVGVQPSRLAYWKSMCQWYFYNTITFHGTPPGGLPMATLVYRFFPDLSGGGATWNNPPSLASGQGPYFGHAAWTLGMKRFMTAWFPGPVAQAGLTWDEVFDRLTAFGGATIPWTGWPQYQLSTLDFENGHTGSDNIWCAKHMNIFTHAALWD